MNLSRRGFFGMLAGAIAGAVFDPEKSLWIRGQKIYSLPPVRITPAAAFSTKPTGNILLTPSEISRAVLQILQRNLRTVQQISGQYNAHFIGDGLPLTGQTIELRRPNRFRHAA